MYRELSSYSLKSVFSVKSRLIFNAFFYRHATQKKINAYKDFHTLAYISVINIFVTDLVLKNKSAISHSCKNYQVTSIKSRLIFNVSYDRHTIQKFVHTKINAYKDFHIFACMSVMKT